jgi:glycosyltransferase involved in cell wall biosynthesis
MTAVSVCIPVFNGERYIGAALASVLAQTFDDYEVVVVDNCSDDKTVDIVEGFDDPRIRLLRNESNIGAEGNWNRAVDEARGRYVKLLCADDLLHPTCLERQVALLDAHPRAAFVAGKRDIVDADDAVLVRGRGLFGMTGEIEPTTALRRVVLSGTNPFGEPVTVLMRDSARRAAGGFSAARPYMIDVDLWARLLDHGTVVASPETVGAFRVSLGSWSYSLAREQVAQSRALFLELQQRHPDAVSGVDVARGTARAAMLMTMRRAAYAWMKAKARRDG